jgi:cell division protease FtsH
MWAVIILLMVFLFNMFNQSQGIRNQVSYSELMQDVRDGRITDVLIQGQNITGRKTDGVPFSTYAPFDRTMVEEMLKNNVNVRAEPREDSPWYVSLLISWLPMILLIGVWIFFMRQMQGGGGKAMSFGRSRARMVSQDSQRVTFDDVAGVDEAKEELTEIVEFLSNPKKFTRLGGRIPKGVLLVGSPGTGKTLLAKAVAGEAGVPFFSISGSDFVEMFVGVGASRVRDLFAQGKKNAPCLIFIDEIDAVGRQRGAGLGGGHDEREQTLNQLLVEMDGFEANEGVILIAATNRPDVLDPALLRPGRFDRQVVVPTPDVRGRKRILEVHSRRAPLAPDVDLDSIAKGTPGMSGADLENLVNEAALLAAKENKDFVAMLDFEEAKDKLIMGKARRTMVLSDNEKRNTAYHEAGHAIVSKFMPESNPVHKITIIPRGRALGFTAYIPEEDKYSVTRTELEGRIAMALGGRAAESLIFGKYTSGAMQDIKMATQTARQMVCELGMSDLIGPIAIGESNSEVFIGREWVSNKNHSEETSKIVDGEVKRIITEGMHKADAILREHEDILHKTAEALLEYETISGEDLDAILKGEPMPIALKLDAEDDRSEHETSGGHSPGAKSGKSARAGHKGAPVNKNDKNDKSGKGENDDDFKLEE